MQDTHFFFHFLELNAFHHNIWVSFLFLEWKILFNICKYTMPTHTFPKHKPIDLSTLIPLSICLFYKNGDCSRSHEASYRLPPNPWYRQPSPSPGIRKTPSHQPQRPCQLPSHQHRSTDNAAASLTLLHPPYWPPGCESSLGGRLLVCQRQHGRSYQSHLHMPRISQTSPSNSYWVKPS